MTIEELKQAIEAATPLPWKAMNGDKRNKNMHQKFGPVICKAPLSQADFDLLRAVNNLPKLLKVAEAAEEAVNAEDAGFEAVNNGGDLTLAAERMSDAVEALSKALEELNNGK